MTELQTRRNFLVIEDKPEESAYLKRLIGEDAIVVGTYKEFETTLQTQGYAAVLSDLYFPSGYESHDSRHIEMKNQTTRALGTYISQYYATNPIARALDQLGKAGFGDTREGVLEKVVMIEGENGVLKLPHIKNTLDDALRRADQEKAYRELQAKIESEEHLMPLGIFVYKEATRQGIPCVIVTDEYHHGIEFQPFTNLVGRFFDQNIAGHKQWSEAAEFLKLL